MPLSSVLLFDLGGVLIENATFESLDRLLPQHLHASVLKQRWLASPSVRRFELGTIPPDEFAASFIAEWELSLTPQTFLHEFTSWPRGFYPGARETLRFLRQRYRIGCLSNCNVLHWEKFGGFENDFDFALSSHIVGAIKPDDEAFMQAIEACGVEPTKIYFFDDSAGNVDTASRLGIRSFHVDGFAPLLDTLHSEGLVAD